MTFHPRRLVGPSTATDEGVARYDGSGGKLLQNTSGVVISDDGYLGIGVASPTKPLHVIGDALVTGNLNVDGYKVVTQGESVLYTDNHLYLNAGYTADTAQTGGLVVNYLPTLTKTTAAGSYVAGVEGSSNPYVETDGYETFVTSDFIQISGSDNNDGLYEVLSHDGYTLSVRGIGLTDTVEDFTQDQFVAGTHNVTDTITKVGVSVLRASTSGAWQSAYGNQTGLSFSSLVAGIGIDGSGTANKIAYWSDEDSLLADSGLHWDSSNDRLGIGSDSPASALEISKTGTDPAITFDIAGANLFTLGIDDSDADKFKIGTSTLDTNTRLTIDNAGLIGVGTSTPGGILHAAHTDFDSTALFERTGASTNSVYVALRLRAVKDSVSLGDGFGSGISFQMASSSGSANNLATIGAERDGVDNSGKLSFITYASGVASERMVIDSSGSIGVGTSEPDEKLHIEGNVSGAVRLQVKNLSSSSGGRAEVAAINNQSGYAQFVATSSTFSAVPGFLSSAAIVSASAELTNGLVLRTGNVATPQPIRFYTGADIERMRIDGNGSVVFNETGTDSDFRVEGDTDPNLLFVDASTDRVGIGTASPGANLHVVAAGDSGLDGVDGIRVSGGTLRPGVHIRAANSTFPQFSIGNLTDDHWAFYASIGSSGEQVAWILNDVVASANRFTVYPTELVVNSGASQTGGSFGNNFDFRVKGENSDHVLFVDASTDRVGIGTVEPVADLQVRGTGSSTGSWKGRIAAGGDTIAFLMGEYNSQAWLGAHNAALSAWSDFYINPDGTGTLYLGDGGDGDSVPVPIVTIRNSQATSSVSITHPVRIGDSSVASWELDVLGDKDGTVLASVGNTSTGTTATAGLRVVSDSAGFEFLTTSSGYSGGFFGLGATPDTVVFVDSLNTLAPVRMLFGARNAIPVYFGQSDIVRATLTNTEMVINDPGNDYDFRVEGNTDQDLLFVDASTDRVGIGTNTPLSKLHVSDGYLVVDGYVHSTTDGIKFPDGTVQITAADGSGGGSSDGIAGAIQFSDGSSGFSSDATNLFWDDANNRLGVGVDTPAAILDVRNSGTEDIFNLFDGSTEVFTVLDGGNVGIGVTDPSARLDISSDGASTESAVSTYSSTGSDRPILSLQRARGTQASPADASIGDYLGSIQAHAYSGSFLDSAAIDFRLDSTPTTGQRPSTRIEFLTTLAGSTPQERMEIGSNGTILINPNGSPDADFRVSGDTKTHLLYVDAGLDQVAIGTDTPNETLTVEGAISLDLIATPSHTAGYGKLFVSSSSIRPFFIDGSGQSYGLTLDRFDTLAWSSSVAIDFSPALPLHRSVALTGNTTFTSSQLGNGRSVRVRIVGDASERTLAFPSGWKWLGGGGAPTKLAANDVAMLLVTSFGTVDSDVVAAWSIESTLEVGSLSASDTISQKTHTNFDGSGTKQETGAVQTTDATQTVLSGSEITLADSTVYWAEAMVVGRDTSGAERAVYRITGCVYQEANGGAVIESQSTTAVAESTNATTWDAVLTVSGDDVRVSVTGAASTTINWSCTVRYQGVSGNT